MRALALGLTVLTLAVPAQAQTAADVINAVEPVAPLENMVKGDYPGMKRESNVVGAIQRAWDNSPSNAGVFVARYSPDQVYKIRVREFMTTTIVLPEWESMAKAVLGDSYGFKAEQTQPHILVVRSALAGADTTLTVIGESGRVYPFYIRAEGYNSQNVPDVAVYVKADRPSDPSHPADSAAVKSGKSEKGKAADNKQASANAARNQDGLEDPDWLRAIPFDPSKLRFDFTMTGDKSIAPDRVFSDGIFTYFDYGSDWDESDLPVVYRVVDGVDTPVNSRSKGKMLIAESAGAFTLRNGQRVVCIRPVGYVPDGSYTPLPKLQTNENASYRPLVFGADGRVPLFPKGTRIVCDYESLAKIGDTRLPINCSRAIRPDGASIQLTDAQGADQMARTGFIGVVDNRIWERYGTAMIVSVLSAASSLGAGVTTNETTARGGNALSQNLGQVTAKVLEQSVDLAPVVEIPAGSKIQIIPRVDIWLRKPEIKKADSEGSSSPASAPANAAKSAPAKPRN